MNNHVEKIINEKLGEEELLCQLAEEAGELVQAALKLRRILSGKNPTPKTETEVRTNLLEELVDIQLVVECLLFGREEYSKMVDIVDRKADRWLKRLEGEMTE